MAGIRSKDTKPEMILRRSLHRRGFRFRLHRRDLPGRPDVVLPKYGTVIFVHGCFWHGHDCRMFKWPKTREAFWRTKIEGNSARDTDALANLAELGWNVEVVWECELRKSGDRIELALNTLADRIRSRREPPTA
ncbi:MAG TPA: very short patch repair endonuclease [Novosphingobium sp.]|nr:very short patch repair endonuclease [Novosphingobium sp.]